MKIQLSLLGSLIATNARVALAQAPNPTAIDDTATVVWNRETSIDVLANDESTLPLLVRQITTEVQPLTGGNSRTLQAAQSGTCRVSTDNTTVIYTPDTGYEGLDSCGYEVCDNRGVPCKFLFIYHL